MNHAHVDVQEKDKEPRTLRHQALDPLRHIWSPGGPHARVGFSTGTQLCFGEVKVTASVEYECDQTTAAVDETGMLAYNKAMEFLNGGVTMFLQEQVDKEKHK